MSEIIIMVVCCCERPVKFSKVQKVQVSDTTMLKKEQMVVPKKTITQVQPVQLPVLLFFCL